MNSQTKMNFQTEEGWAGSELESKCYRCKKQLHNHGTAIRANDNGAEGICTFRADYCTECAPIIIDAIRNMVI